jgi:hypothetical protein
MAKVETITCDVCGKIKGEVNHWFKASSTDGSDEIIRGFSVYPSDEPIDRGFVYLDLCGQSCVVQAINSWMQKKPVAQSS